MAGSSREDEDVEPLMAVTAKRKSTNVASLADSGHPQVRKTHASLNVSVNGDKRIGKPRGSATITPIRPPIPNTWGRNPTGPVTAPGSNLRDHPYSPSKKKKPVGESKNSRNDPDTETRMRPEDEFNRLNEEMTRRSRRDEATKSSDPHSEETRLNQGETESAMQLAPKLLSTAVKPDAPETSLHPANVIEALPPGSFADEMRAEHESSKPFEATGSTNESDDESSESDKNYEVDTSMYKVSDFSLHHTEGALHRSEPSIPSTSMERSSSPIKTSQHDNEASGLASGELVLPKSLPSLVKEPEPSVSSRSSFEGSMTETSDSHVDLKASSKSLPSRRSSSSIGSIVSDHERKSEMSSSSLHATVTSAYNQEAEAGADDNEVRTVEADYNQVEEVESDYEEPITPDVKSSQGKLANESKQMSKTASTLESSWLEDDGENISHDSINQLLSTVNPFLRNFFSPVMSIPSYIVLEDQENLRHSFLHDLVHQFARHAADTCRTDLLSENWKALRLILSHVNTRCSLLFPNANFRCENDLIRLVQFYEGLVPIWIRAFRVLLPSYKALEGSVFPVSQSPDDLVLPMFEKRPRSNDFRESIRSDLLDIMFPRALVNYLRNPMDAGTNIDPRQPQTRQIELGTLLLPHAINATMILLMGRRLAQFFHFMKDDDKLKALFPRSERSAFRRNACLYDPTMMID